MSSGGADYKQCDRALPAELGSEIPKSRDEIIRGRVRRQLDEHCEIDTSTVEIRVTKARVRLFGRVDNHHAQRLSERVAKQEVPGVKDVQNDIEFTRDDSEAPHSL